MSAVAGTRTLVRLALRRDRILLPAWIATFVAMAAFSAAATIDLYPTLASRVHVAQSSNSTPALVALYGRVYDEKSVGAISMIKMGGVGAALVAVLAFMLVIRHTRAEEEAGRLELLGATVVGRHAPLSAALIVAAGTSLVIAVLTALGLVAVGLPAAGSIAFGLAWAATGIAFAAVGALAAQLTASARAATGIAAAVLGAAYVLRAVGDAAGEDGPTWVSWLSPIGWSQQVRPYAGDRWAILLLLAAFAAAVAAGAYAIVARRDIGAGLLPDRPGPATATASLSSPLGLAWRLQRGALLAWTVAFALFGIVLGSIASGVGDFLESPQARDIIAKLGGPQMLTDAFLAAELGIVGVIASVYGIQAAMRLRSEEASLRAEAILATAAGRVRWAASHIAVAFIGTTTILLAGGLAAGLTHAAQTGEPGEIGRVVAGALVQLPAAWVLTGIVVAVFGLAPRLIAAAWGALVLFLLLGELGPVLELQEWVMDVSPFAHVPRLPGAEFSAAPLLWLSAIAAALTVTGLAAFRRRDID